MSARQRSMPAHTRLALRDRLERHALDRWGEHCRAITVRFRGAFAYVDALPKNTWHPPDTPPELRVQIDATPTHLCRLGYLGSTDRWAFAFYKYSDEVYEPSFLPSGGFEGTPEEAFDCAAEAYLAR